MICSRCEIELALEEGLCAVCTAEALELDVRVVEPGRARHEGNGARLMKSPAYWRAKAAVERITQESNK